MRADLGVRIGLLREDRPTPDLLPLSKETMMLLGKKGMDPQSPIFIRVLRGVGAGAVEAARRWPILPQDLPDLQLVGRLGPKVKQGDRQAPEGFYTVSREQMNPN